MGVCLKNTSSKKLNQNMSIKLNLVDKIKNDESNQNIIECK